MTDLPNCPVDHGAIFVTVQPASIDDVEALKILPFWVQLFAIQAQQVQLENKRRTNRFDVVSCLSFNPRPWINFFSASTTGMTLSLKSRFLNSDENLKFCLPHSCTCQTSILPYWHVLSYRQSFCRLLRCPLQPFRQ